VGANKDGKYRVVYGEFLNRKEYVFRRSGAKNWGLFNGDRWVFMVLAEYSYVPFCNQRTISAAVGDLQRSYSRSRKQTPLRYPHELFLKPYFEKPCSIFSLVVNLQFLRIENSTYVTARRRTMRI
jgi:hypothetical protein